ncbi:TIGR02594 family protein [Aeromonas veronii]|uniref:TIGR02594 family protein n=1 Tax=Aeromonas veronii TaxID=654 RepID=UPI001E521E9F|nr:TIGR02594 family protein [Aeromonas veronii]
MVRRLCRGVPGAGRHSVHPVRGARSYASWGEKLEKPVAGCVVVFSRDGGGHVGFVVGQDKAGNLLVLGGNQADAVNVKAFPRSRVTAYRWPAGEPKPVGELPVMAAAEFSKSEA